LQRKSLAYEFMKIYNHCAEAGMEWFNPFRNQSVHFIHSGWMKTLRLVMMKSINCS